MSRKRKFSLSEEDEIVLLYANGQSVAKISEQFAASNTAVRNALKRHDVQFRPRKSPTSESEWTVCGCGNRVVYTAGLCRPCYDKRRNADPRVQDSNFTRKLAYQFKISRERYDYLLESQGNMCAICGQADPRGYRLSVDHSRSCCKENFSCGFCVRGLLCLKCNSGLGSFGDNPENLRRAADYVEKWLEFSLAEQDAKLFFTEMADPREL